MDKTKYYEKCKNKKCVICNLPVTMKDIQENKIEMTITKKEIYYINGGDKNV